MVTRDGEGPVCESFARAYAASAAPSDDATLDAERGAVVGEGLGPVAAASSAEAAFMACHIQNDARQISGARFTATFNGGAMVKILGSVAKR